MSVQIDMVIETKTKQNKINWFESYECRPKPTRLVCQTYAHIPVEYNGNSLDNLIYLRLFLESKTFLS